MKRLFLFGFITLIASSIVAPVSAQWTPEKPGSDNMEVLGHLPLGPQISLADLEIEQEMNRPYAYVARVRYGPESPRGTDIIDLSDPANPHVIYEWRIEDDDLHVGTGGMGQCRRAVPPGATASPPRSAPCPRRRVRPNR